VKSESVTEKKKTHTHIQRERERKVDTMRQTHITDTKRLRYRERHSGRVGDYERHTETEGEERDTPRNKGR